MAVHNSISRPILLPSCSSSYPSSSKSSLEGSPSTESGPPGLTMTKSDTNGTIRFAPLPQLSPRKRRSKPMGVAARSAYMRERRLAATETEIQDYRVENAAWNVHLPEEGRLEDDMEERDYDIETEDPFLALGKMMKEAGKGIWKHVVPRERRKLKGSEDKKELDVAVHDPEKGGLDESSLRED